MAPKSSRHDGGCHQTGLGETGRELVERHVRAFNHGVGTGDWEPMLSGLAEHAELSFENAPVGPFAGLEEIRRAHLAQPPDDELRLLGSQDTDERTAVAAFAWTRGGTGRLVVEHERGVIVRLTVIFDDK